MIEKLSLIRKKFPSSSDRRSQAMLVAILMITAAALAIVLAIATLGSSQVKMALSSKESSQAYGLAEACLENTLIRLVRQDTSQPPIFTLTSGNCIIEITGSSPYQIIATSQVGRAFSKLRATVSIDNEVLNIESWQEY